MYMGQKTKIYFFKGFPFWPYTNFKLDQYLLLDRGGAAIIYKYTQLNCTCQIDFHSDMSILTVSTPLPPLPSSLALRPVLKSSLSCHWVTTYVSCMYAQLSYIIQAKALMFGISQIPEMSRYCTQ